MFFLFLSAGIFLSVGLLLVLSVGPLVKTLRMKQRLKKTGMEADAELLGLKQAGLYFKHRPQVILQVKVRSLTGTFTADVREVLSCFDLLNLRVGSVLKVRYNPANIHEVVLVRQ